MFSQAGSVLPEPYLMVANSDLLCCVSQLHAFPQFWSIPAAHTFDISAKPIVGSDNLLQNAC